MKGTFNKTKGTLKVGGNVYKVRYCTSKFVVCNTDELQGKFGDEYPVDKVKIER